MSTLRAIALSPPPLPDRHHGQPRAFDPPREPRAARRKRKRGRTSLLRVVPVALAAALIVPACGSDGDAAKPVTADSTEAKTTTSHDGHVTTTASGGVAKGEVTVHAVDFSFEQLPAKVEPGTKFTLVNDAKEELHELVAFKLPDDEDRSADELMKLPEAELGKLFGSGPPAMVLLAKPGEPQIAAVGDGTLTEPGRYLVACSIPTGADPDEVLESEGPASADMGGPPHFTHGMYGEVTVV